MEGSPDLDALELSKQVGEGTLSMSTVVQKAMVNILGPLASRLVDLEEKAENHDRHITDLLERTEASSSKLDGHNSQLNKVTFDLSKANEEIRRTQDLLQDAFDKHTALQADHDTTRSLATHLDCAQKATAASLGDLTRSFEELDLRVREMQTSLSDTASAHLKINDRLSEIRNRMEGLNDRHLELVKTVQAMRQSDENNHQAVRRHVAAFDKFKRESERSLLQLDEKTKALEATTVDLNHAVDSHQRLGKVQKNEMAQVRAQLDNLFGAQRRSEGPSTTSTSAAAAGAGVAGGPRDMHGRLHKLEEQVSRLEKSVSADKNQMVQLTTTLSETLAKNTEDIHQNRQDIDVLEKALKNDEHRLHQCEKHDQDQSSKVDHLKELLRKSEAETRTFLTTMQKDADTQLSQHSNELNRLNSISMQTTQKVEATSVDVNRLHSELHQTNSNVSRLSLSLDLAHEYFEGLTKGFQDTHRRVVSVSDGMLPPRGTGTGVKSPSKTLPVIPGQPPRPASAIGF